jgi:hypothetical protein
MHLLRGNYTRRIFILLAGVAFLNLSFILAEISALGLAKKYKSLVQMVTNAGLEEEKEMGGGESGETDSAEVDIIGQSLTHYKLLFSAATDRNKKPDNRSVHPGHTEKFSPPPDAISLSC